MTFMQARYRRDDAHGFNGVAFSVDDIIRAFSIAEADAVCRHVA
ncbi:hypothetical protein [Burkholderia ambifaria]|nr:hypothetical protein [Burkholderia ambifaria]